FTSCEDRILPHTNTHRNLRQALALGSTRRRHDKVGSIHNNSALVRNETRLENRTRITLEVNRSRIRRSLSNRTIRTRSDQRRIDPSSDNTTSGGIVTNHTELLKMVEGLLSTIIPRIHAINRKGLAINERLCTRTNTNVQDLRLELTRSTRDGNIFVVRSRISRTSREGRDLIASTNSQSRELLSEESRDTRHRALETRAVRTFTEIGERGVVIDDVLTESLLIAEGQDGTKIVVFNALFLQASITRGNVVPFRDSRNTVTKPVIRRLSSITKDVRVDIRSKTES